MIHLALAIPKLFFAFLTAKILDVKKTIPEPLESKCNLVPEYKLTKQNSDRLNEEINHLLFHVRGW